MPDAEIEVIIKVIDEMSDKLKNIEATVKNTAETTNKQTQIMSQGFTDTTDKLLAIGNAASAYDRIQSTAINTQIRLENATDRVRNAQDRLEDAQRNLIKVQNDNNSSLEDIANAQREVDRSTRNLAISQNNLKRVHESLTGTYINIGIQTIQLIAAVPKLITIYKDLTSTINTLNIAQAIMKGLSNPIALGIGLAAAAAGVMAIKNIMASESTDELSASQQNMIGSINNATDGINNQVNSLDNLDQKLMKMAGISFEGEDKLKGQINTVKNTLAEQKLKYNELTNIAYNFDTEEGRREASRIEEERANLTVSIRQKEAELKRLTELYRSSYEERRNIAEEAIKDGSIKEAEFQNTITSIQGTELGNRLEQIHNFAVNARNELQPVYDLQVKIASFNYTAGGTKISKGTQVISPPSFKADINPVPNFSLGDLFKGNSTYIGANTTRMNDFVMRPGQGPVSFSKDDTLIGVKDVNTLGNGVTINIENVYGINPSQLSVALKKELSTKLRI